MGGGDERGFGIGWCFLRGFFWVDWLFLLGFYAFYCLVWLTMDRCCKRKWEWANVI